MKSIFSTAALALALSATAGLAQEATTFDIDRDADNGASFESFNASFSELGIYSEWDANGDGMLDEDEFNRGVFSQFDSDDDAYWNEDEFNAMQNSDWDAPVKAGQHGAESEAAEDAN